MRKKRVLFICTGNTCRSPLAEAFLNDLAGDRFEALSAGVFAENGSPISRGSAHVLEQEGLTTEHTSQPVSDELIEWLM
ncbi:low molecular weight phosphatase family protein [Bacillus sp. JCM 19041]|uniref:arsenate reductase/protein-tyrosine-phosphatase family protein n=1 Tax=Bacillus sp. JCM 19041 TaxID=1460637 RepID=UPI0006D026A3